MKRIICFILLFPALSIAQVARKYSNEFLSIGVGARALGMSNASVAASNDVTSGYWNPAGLTGIKSNIQVGLMHSEYFAGIAKYDYGAFATKIDSQSAFGISMLRFGVDNIPNTIDLIDAAGNVDYDKITSFSAVDYAFLLSYARKMKVPGLALGANAKVIRRIAGDFGGAWGFGLDVGARYSYKNWLLAAMARDVTGTFNAWSYTFDEDVINTFTMTGNEIPKNSLEVTLPRLTIAASRNFVMARNFTILPELDLEMTFDGKRNTLIKSNFASIDPRFGFEAGYKNIIFLRGGVGNFQKYTDFNGKRAMSFQPNIGVGVRIKALAIDYALTDIGDQSVALYSNVFSLKLDINKKSK